MTILPLHAHSWNQILKSIEKKIKGCKLGVQWIDDNRENDSNSEKDNIGRKPKEVSDGGI